MRECLTECYFINPVKRELIKTPISVAVSETEVVGFVIDPHETIPEKWPDIMDSYGPFVKIVPDMEAIILYQRN